MIPLFPTTCLLLSLLFLLIQHRKAIRSIFRKYTTPNYSRLPVYQHEVELDHLHRDHQFTTNGYVAPPATPLSRYFDPDTSVIYPGVMEPPFPIIPEMSDDCYSVDGDEDEGEWVNEMVDSVVKWVVKKVQEGPSSSGSTS
ncbi:hypothetical protein BO79DRAFT_244844 [Aspergillus costaricaensis CBS 115574]|uniref:Uncharacterized protein n=1 Tax=Aspergillus costaricaensis CBS 115574 TaxID=1448317 RepID=A0ACD1IIR2_9EURO|nr:hypothetical protein BO79DRAFT_244844 [Aspergillus costaricaensis CBS 115574]RAK89985.1 hypothetical protein BO79DRAFT_244844 [Aspergillus costaricaensis CBS 115574]